MRLKRSICFFWSAWIVSTAATFGHADDAYDTHLTAGVQAHRSGDFKQALREELWCLDNLGRITPALQIDLERLVRDFPPTKGELMKRLEAAEQSVVAAKTDFDGSCRYLILCELLGENQRLPGV